MKKIWLAGLMVLTLAIPSLGWAQNPTEDDDITVVTIRKKYFLKDNRQEFNLHGGYVPNDSFIHSLVVGGGYGYHYTEDFFLELTGGYFFNYNTDSTDLLKGTFGITPDTDDLEYYGELHFGWSPIYGKLNFLTRKIVYFDVSSYLGGGVSQAQISGLSPHGVIGIASRWVLSKCLTLRLDIKDQLVIRDDTGVDGTLRNVVYVILGFSFFAPIK